MKTKNKIIYIFSLILFIASSFIVASMIFLQDKKSIYDEQNGNVETSNENKPSNVEKAEQTNNDNFENTLDPKEFVDKQSKAIIDDVEKQEISLEEEVDYFN